jgi:hypothetical protein
MSKVKVIPVPKNVWDLCEPYLSTGRAIPDCARDEVVYIFTADFGNGYEMDVKVCNAETENGGAFIDPVLFYKGSEVACAEVGGSLDCDYNIEYGNTIYTMVLMKPEA